MPNGKGEVNGAVDSQTKRPANRSSVAVKLVQAAALASVLVPLGTVAVETSSITCGFGTYNPGYSGAVGTCNSIAGSDSDQFRFAPDIRFTLTFQGVPTADGFDVTITDNPMSEAAFEARSGAFPGYVCLPIDPADGDGFDTPGSPCQDFIVSPSVPRLGNWTTYTVKASWLFNTETGGFPDNGGHVRLLHNPGVDGGPFTIDMCLDVTGPGCTYTTAFDPGISSGDQDFHDFAVAYAPTGLVPEPATLALLGTGLTGILYRRRRRRRHATAPTRP